MGCISKLVLEKSEKYEVNSALCSSNTVQSFTAATICYGVSKTLFIYLLFLLYKKYILPTVGIESEVILNYGLSFEYTFHHVKLLPSPSDANLHLPRIFL